MYAQTRCSLQKASEESFQFAAKLCRKTILNVGITFQTHAIILQAMEELRLRERQLDLRRPTMQHNLRLRSQVAMAMREFLIHEHGKHTHRNHNKLCWMLQRKFENAGIQKIPRPPEHYL